METESISSSAEDNPEQRKKLKVKNVKKPSSS